MVTENLTTKTFKQSMQQTWYRRMVIYICVMVTLIFVTQILEVFYG